MSWGGEGEKAIGIIVSPSTIYCTCHVSRKECMGWRTYSVWIHEATRWKVGGMCEDMLWEYLVVFFPLMDYHFFNVIHTKLGLLPIHYIGLNEVRR